MISQTEKNILRDIDDYSVILHGVNCSGFIQPGLSTTMSKQFPGWFQDFHAHCRWFEGHENEIFGAFHRFQPDLAGKNVIICSAFTQYSGSNSSYVDLDAWGKVLNVVKQQTKRVQQMTGKHWTIHINSNIGSTSNEEANQQLLDMFDELFGMDADVDICIHQR